MSRLIPFPEPPVTEADIRAAYALKQISWDADTQARLAIQGLCERVKRGAAIEVCSDLDFIPEIRAIRPRPRPASTTEH